jgi:1,4-dihydroxy-2-naphthoate octaprenyltransferase
VLVAGDGGQGSPTLVQWVHGARLRTLPLAVAPVILGTASAYLYDRVNVVAAVLALVVALGLQIGVNYSNDYSDGIRGTDTHRVGPARLTGSGVANPKAVLAVAVLFFALAGIAGLGIVVITGLWWLVVVGALAIVAAWFYTGGKRPYGYRGLGELAVFVFFGLVATIGTAYIQVGFVPWETWLTGSAAGFFAVAVLMENNLRDIEQDKKAGKKTLAVIVGDRATRVLTVFALAIPYGILALLSLFFFFAPYVYITLLLAAPTAFIVLTAKTPRELVLTLQLSSVNALVFALGLSLAIAF